MRFTKLVCYVVGATALILVFGQSAFADSPTTPTNFRANVYSDTAAEIFWERSVDNDIVKGYELTRNGQVLGIFDALSFFDDSLFAGETYRYTINALDFDDNRSAQSSLTLIGGSHSMPSTGDVNSPVNLRADVYSVSAIELFWDRASTPGLSYEINLDGTVVGITDGTSYFVDGLSGGRSYIVDVQAIDISGSRSVVATVQVTTTGDGGGGSFSAPQNARLQAYSSSAVELFWTNSDGSDAVEVSRNGEYLDTVFGRSYYDDARPHNTNQTYSLIAINNDELRSEPVQIGRFETAMLSPDAANLAANDYGSVVVSGDTALIAADREGLERAQRASGAVYVFTRDTNAQWQPTQRLVTDENADRFGLAVAIDGNTMAISHRDNVDILPDEGTVRGVTMYTREATGQWVVEQRISAVTSAPAYRFGDAIAIDGDTMMISANTNFAGSIVFVFSRDGSGRWNLQQEITIATDDNGIGSAIDIDGDTAILGDYRDAVNGFLSGAAWIYQRDEEGVWQSQQILRPATSNAGDFLGTSVAIEGDTAVIGGEESEQVYVYTRNDKQWLLSDLIDYELSESEYYQEPGTAVGLSNSTLIVGVSSASELGYLTGAVYVYEKTSGSWKQQLVLGSSDGERESEFGSTVAIDDGAVVVSARPPGAEYFSAITGYVFELP